MRGRTTISRARSSSPSRSINALLAKKTATEQALAGYSRAAQYGVAEVTTAAGWAMADLYRDLGKSLLDSERPPSLSQEEREAYDVLLEEQAFPFEEKAIEIHETNARRAADGVYDNGCGRATPRSRNSSPHDTHAPSSTRIRPRRRFPIPPRRGR